MTRSLIRYNVDARGVARIVLDDPASRNALGDALLDQLIERLEQARTDDAVRAVVLASADDRVFSSGGNLKAFAAETAISRSTRAWTASRGCSSCSAGSASRACARPAATCWPAPSAWPWPATSSWPGRASGSAARRSTSASSRS
jgi:enoyl-CoA hydratase/carnithine racemase